MLSILNCPAHKINMGIMGSCDIDYINIRVCKHVIIIIIYLFLSRFFCKFNCFLMGSVAHRIDVSPVFSFKTTAISFAITPVPELPI